MREADRRREGESERGTEGQRDRETEGPPEREGEDKLCWPTDMHDTCPCGVGGLRLVSIRLVCLQLVRMSRTVASSRTATYELQRTKCGAVARSSQPMSNIAHIQLGKFTRVIGGGE